MIFCVITQLKVEGLAGHLFYYIVLCAMDINDEVAFLNFLNRNIYFFYFNSSSDVFLLLFTCFLG